MRRDPIVLAGATAAVGLYALAREIGHLCALGALGLKMQFSLRYGFLPAVGPDPAGSVLSRGAEIAVIASGPGFALVSGYLVLRTVIHREHLGSPIARHLALFFCYVALILDPAYYMFIPMFRLGGEPERLVALLAINPLVIQVIALALLAVNSIIARRMIVPRLRRE